MAALDFPSSPSVGQTYPNPAVSGQPVYSWDGEKWISGTGYGNIYISDTPPAAPVGSLWWESDTGVLYVRYYDGTSTQWCSIAGSPQDVVRYGAAQTLTAAQQTQARQNVYAAPFDALASQNLIVNSAMEVSQEFGLNTNITLTASGSTTTKYVADGVVAVYRGSFVAQIAQVDLRAFTGGNDFGGYNKSMWMQISTGQASLGTNDIMAIQFPIEANRIGRLSFGLSGARPITVGFLFYSQLGGTYSGSIRNGAGARSYPFSFTAAAGTVTYQTVTIPGDVAGTWVNDNTTGMVLTINLAAGSSFLGAANAWVAGNLTGVTGSANGVATGNIFYISGVVMFPGIEAPSLARAPLILRPYDQELVLCQRYFNAIQTAGITWQVSGVTNSQTISTNYPTMRVNPTVTGLPWTDANYINNTPTTGNQWTFMVPGVAYAAKSSGTVSVSVTSASPRSLVMNFSGATFSISPIALQGGPTLTPILLDARL